MYNSSFNRFERYLSPSGSVRYASVGFATVYQYYAYPNHTRPRIAQILILPPFQSNGLGAELLRAIYVYYIGRNEVKDITGKTKNMKNTFFFKLSRKLILLIKIKNINFD